MAIKERAITTKKEKSESPTIEFQLHVRQREYGSLRLLLNLGLKAPYKCLTAESKKQPHSLIPLIPHSARYRERCDIADTVLRSWVALLEESTEYDTDR